MQDAVSAGGPLLAILGFLLLPIVWSVPEALITAELATTFPENSGYVAWVTAAFGPFWGFQVLVGLPHLSAVILVDAEAAHLSRHQEKMSVYIRNTSLAMLACLCWSEQHVRYRNV